MWDLLIAGGWLMLPIMLCSVVALAVILERFWSLRTANVSPSGLVNKTWQSYRDNQLDAASNNSLRANSLLGRILSTCLSNQHHTYTYIKAQVEESGKQVAHEMNRYLEVLSTIAAITPLLGLLGTVIGMIDVFFTINVAGVGDSQVLAGGISQALITTASGLAVAIPTVIASRYFRTRVDAQLVGLEAETQRFLSAMEEYRQAGRG